MVRPADVEALKQLALLGAMHEPAELASADFARLIEVSQQTGSRRLIELADEGLIERELGMRRQRIHITEAGRDLLHAEHMLYRRLFEAQQEMILRGRVATGLGEGRYYLSRPGYDSQFVAALGWRPFPGTLNLELTSTDANKLKALRRAPVHVIEGFEAEGRTFGGVVCSPATIDGTECAAILPNRSHYTSTLEVIAPTRLRDSLPCEDGDELTVTVRLAE